MAIEIVDLLIKIDFRSCLPKGNSIKPPLNHRFVYLSADCSCVSQVRIGLVVVPSVTVTESSVPCWKIGGAGCVFFFCNPIYSYYGL